jgi:hypothetical protein
MNWNYCPNCGHRIYQHNDGDGCIHETQIHHIIRVHEAAGFTIKHPLAEREQDKLMDCPVHQQILGSAPPSWIKPGDYALVYASDGWAFESVDKATQMCDCHVTHAQLLHA